MWPIQLTSPLYTIRRTFLFSLTLCNTSSLLTRSAQLICSILLQHHSSKLSRYFWPSFRNVHVSAPHTVMGRMWHFNCFLLTFESHQLLTKVSMLNATVANAILRVIARVLLAWKYESEPAWPTRDTVQFLSAQCSGFCIDDSVAVTGYTKYFTRMRTNITILSTVMTSPQKYPLWPNLPVDSALRYVTQDRHFNSQFCRTLHY